MAFWNRNRVVNTSTEIEVLKELDDAIRKSTAAVNRNTEQTVKVFNEMTKALNKMSTEFRRTK